MADGFGVAGVGEVLQGVAEGAQLGAFQGATGAGGVGLVGGRQETGAGEQREDVFFQGADPEVLGPGGVLVEVAAVSFEAISEVERQPDGGCESVSLASAAESLRRLELYHGRGLGSFNHGLKFPELGGTFASS